MSAGADHGYHSNWLQVIPSDVSGVHLMHESDTYQAIFDEGRELQIKENILRLAQRRFGLPAMGMADRVNGITDFERLERIRDRLLDATNWQDLLDTP